ncbi:MAG: transglycosylase domain-containing protein [Tissierellia bacterium]|nr:transglycosylase domain-containing protein [Tissierellia bacterium]
MQHRNMSITPVKILRYFILIALLIIIVFGTIFALAGVRIMEEVKEVDPRVISKDLSETSFIYDLNEHLIEKIETPEYRTMVGIEKIPAVTKNAFIAIEDERFIKHIGISPIGIMASLRDTFLYGETRGASTITQQLVKNTYLTPERTLKRKLTEARIAIELEKKLSKDQILEAYLNRVSMGQNAYGIQEAAQTYFSKDVEKLNAVESAMLAAIAKSPNIYPPYMRVLPKDYDPETMYKVGQVDIHGQTYIQVYNPENEKRMRIVLRQMKKNGSLNEAEYNAAMKIDPKTLLKPGQKKSSDITNYMADYTKDDVVQGLMDKFGWTKERAQDELFYGGLKIYCTIDVAKQKALEEAYRNFTSILLGDPANLKGPILLDIKADAYGNIVDDKGKFVYLNKDNMITQEGHIYLAPDEFTYQDNGDLVLQSVKLQPYKNNIDILDYYTIDDEKNLVSHTVGSLPFGEGEFTRSEGKVIIPKAALEKHEGLFTVVDKYLHIDKAQVYINTKGVVQPQSATVLVDYRTGHILAMVGGRDQDGNRILNRATGSSRQPGSAIKPISVYLPALANNFTAGSSIDDIPFYVNGKVWPQNWYLGYRGKHTLRYAVEQSINVSAVRVLNEVGIPTVKPYLEKMGIINVAHPDRDTFVTSSEDPKYNDENLSSLALGGMTNGLTPLAITAAFGSIANEGFFNRPISYTKVVDRDGNILLENPVEPVEVTSPQVAYIMKDILRSVVTHGIGTRAAIQGQAVGGKTGTTQHTADLWFVGFTNYYVAGTWIGNDSPRVRLNKNSMVAAQFWQYFMKTIHEGLESKPNFPMPEGIVKATFCNQSGKVPTELCSEDPQGTIRTDIFINGTQPKEPCEAHVEVEICTESGMLANEYCPKDLRETRVMVQRTPPYDPEEHSGVVPSDYQYQVPVKTCDIHNEENTVPEFIDIFDPQDEENGENHSSPRDENYNAPPTTHDHDEEGEPSPEEEEEPTHDEEENNEAVDIFNP